MNNLAQQPDKYPELIKTLNMELQKRIDEGSVMPAGLTPAKSSGKKKKPSQKETEEGGG